MTIHGRLDNDPLHIRDLKAGDSITFDASHVIQTEHADDDNLVERFAGKCLVSRRVLVDRSKVGFLYREAPDDEQDSGWRFMAGDESAEYLDDSRNLARVSVGAVLSLDDSFVDLLDSPEGSEFERDGESDAFVALG